MGPAARSVPEVQEFPDQDCGALPVSVLNVCIEILRHHRKVGEGSGPLHQGPSHERAARRIGGEHQLPGDRLGVQIRGAVRDHAAHKSVQKVLLLPEQTEKTHVLQVHTVTAEGDSEQNGTEPFSVLFLRTGSFGPAVPEKGAGLLRSAEKAGPEPVQRCRQDVRKSSVFHSRLLRKDHRESQLRFMDHKTTPLMRFR